MCDGSSLEGIRLIVGALPRACAQGEELEARGHMLVAAVKVPSWQAAFGCGEELPGAQAAAFKIAFLTSAFTTSTLSWLRASGCAFTTARLAASCARASLGA